MDDVVKRLRDEGFEVSRSWFGRWKVTQADLTGYGYSPVAAFENYLETLDKEVVRLQRIKANRNANR